MKLFFNTNIRLNRKPLLISLLFIFFSMIISACSGNTLKKDETVLFFPSAANLNADGNWQLPVHNWVFEKEENDLSRKITQKVFSEVLEGLGVSEKQASAPRTQKRLMWFLVDNKRNKKIDVSLAGKIHTLNQTAPNGHAITTLTLAAQPAKKYQKQGGWVSVKAQDPFKRNFSGEIQLIPSTGVSIISDIDDTIKISEVLDKKALVKNIFAKPYVATPGFPQYYKRMQQKGAYFHYVSASPWQLYPSLEPFLAANYPKGSVALRNFRIKDSSLIKFLRSSENYKIETISEIIKRYPKHQFILIGDSGEHDPEVYTKIYQKFPKNIKSIQIRAVENSNMAQERFNALFKIAPKSLWQIFTEPKW